MGKSRRQFANKNFAQKRREKQKRKDEWDKTTRRSYAEIVRENNSFDSYYKTQKIVPNEEWNIFIDTMKENLPVAFRITGTKGETKALLEIIKGDFFKEIVNSKIAGNLVDGSTEVIPKCLSFYPHNLGWQLQLTRKDIRRSEVFFKLHNFLISETNSGNISRQEAVSMIPPLLLDVKPWHKVLDMCAAPGSKTAQLIEMIHVDQMIPLPNGFVIANDLNNNRCYMLVHQAKRLNSPNILITNHDASVMPNFSISECDGKHSLLKFDRILADVPCSGDGTMRKNPDIWNKWSPANGNNLHGIQYRIAKRGVELLTIGGKMVYSTCSLNPIENEAVVHRLLSETKDSVRLLDCKSFLPGLVFNSGITHWKPASKTLEYFDNWKDVPEQLKTQIRPMMFPPKDDEADIYHLERCMRILPHHQNTGGFFIAILEKVKSLPWEYDININVDVITRNELNSINNEVEDTNFKKKRVLNEKNPGEPKRKLRRFQGFREDPFVFFNKKNEDLWLSIKTFYNISDELDPQCLLVRCHEGKKKNIYYSSRAIRDIIISNENNVKMINTGVKVFVRCDNKNTSCAFRLAQEGLSSIVKFIGDRRKINIPKSDLIMLLENNDHHSPPKITSLDPLTQEKLINFDKGSCVLVYHEEKKDYATYPLKIELVGWRGLMSLRAYVSIHDAIHYLRLLGADFSKLEKNKFQDY